MPASYQTFNWILWMRQAKHVANLEGFQLRQILMVIRISDRVNPLNRSAGSVGRQRRSVVGVAVDISQAECVCRGVSHLEYPTVQPRHPANVKNLYPIAVGEAVSHSGNNSRSGLRYAGNRHRGLENVAAGLNKSNISVTKQYCVSVGGFRGKLEFQHPRVLIWMLDKVPEHHSRPGAYPPAIVHEPIMSLGEPKIIFLQVRPTKKSVADLAGNEGVLDQVARQAELPSNSAAGRKDGNICSLKGFPEIHEPKSIRASCQPRFLPRSRY